MKQDDQNQNTIISLDPVEQILSSESDISEKKDKVQEDLDEQIKDEPAEDDGFFDDLPEVFPPFLPRKTIMESPYTLVLDLDETLIHFVSNQGNDDEDEHTDSNKEEEDEDGDFFYMVRPFCNKFLTELSKYFELVIFTAAM